jgi:hypothetical protein
MVSNNRQPCIRQEEMDFQDFSEDGVTHSDERKADKHPELS